MIPQPTRRRSRRRRRTWPDDDDTAVFNQLPDVIKKRILGFDCPADQCFLAHDAKIQNDRQEYVKRCGPIVENNIRRACLTYRDPAKFKRLVDRQVRRLARNTVRAAQIEVDIALATLEKISGTGGDMTYFFDRPVIHFITADDGRRSNEVLWIDNGGAEADSEDFSTVAFVDVEGVTIETIHAFQDRLQGIVASLARFWEGLRSAHYIDRGTP